MSGEEWKQSLGATLKETASKHAMKLALVSPTEGIAITYRQLAAEVDKLASSLLSLGIKPGDGLLLWGGNHGFLVVAALAAARAGIIFTALHPGASPDELNHLINWLEVRAVIAFPTQKEGQAYATLTKLCPELDKPGSKGNLESRAFPSLKLVVIAEDSARYPGAHSLNELFQIPAGPGNLEEADANRSPDDLLTIQMTMGGSGEAKGVRLSHRQFLTAGAMAARRLYLDAGGESLLCAMPLWRSGVLSLVLGGMAGYGAKVVLPAPQPLPAPIFKAIQDYQCTVMLSHPVAFHLMLRMPMARKADLSSITSVCFVGDHVPVDLIGMLQKNTSVADITVGLFVTEAACMPIFFPSDGDPTKILSSLGKASPPFQASVRSLRSGTTEVQPGRPGELWLRPIGAFLGYHKDKEATEQACKDGWIATGDVVRMDEAGYVELLGSKADVVSKDGSEPLFLWEIEKKLQSHKGITAAQQLIEVVERAGELVVFALLRDKAMPATLYPALADDLRKLASEASV